MKKIFLPVAFGFFVLISAAQNVGIGTSNPQNKLHVGGGLRLDTLIGVGGSGLLRHDANGVVYGIKFSGNVADVLRGDGTFGSGGVGLVGWSLSGNSGTNPSANFIGTTDDQPLVFKIRNRWSGIIDSVFSNTALGFKSGYSLANGKFNTALGVQSLFSNTDGQQNTAIGNWALISNTTGNDNTAVGNNALRSNNGNSNTAMGNWALLSNEDGEKNTGVGDNALSRNTSGIENTAAGYWSLLSNTTGNYNTAIGTGTLFANTTGYQNSAMGYQALTANVEGYRNVANGDYSLYSNTYGSFNVANGASALLKNGNGSDNTAVGAFALWNQTYGYQNTALGYSAGTADQAGAYNTFVGAFSTGAENVTNSTAIGYSAYVSQNNTIAFGNGTTAYAFGRSGVQPGAALQVGGCVFGNCSAGSGAYLSYGGTWTNGSSITFKEDFSTLDKTEILDKISSLNISRWKYKNSNNEYHIGPIAEEFYKAFNVGTNEKYLSTIDPSGVALAGIQELIIQGKEQQAVIENLNKRIEEQQKQIDGLIRKVSALNKN